MKKYIASLCVLLSLLLTGCEGEPVPTPEPTPTPTPRAEPLSTLELSLGEGLRSFYVELVPVGELGELRVDIYKEKRDHSPFQSFEAAVPNYMLSSTKLTAEDVDFDGYTDFHFPVNVNSQGDSNSCYYVWSSEKGKFVPDPYGLNGMPNLYFNGERREATTFRMMDKHRLSYQYEAGALLQVGERYIPAGEESFREARITRRIAPDPEHTFWAELTQEGERGEGEDLPVVLTLYTDMERTEVFQRFEDACMVNNIGYIDLWEEDVDFDGCADLCYSSWAGAHSFGMTALVWEPERGEFLPDPYGLRELSLPSFDPENRVIKTWNYSGGDNETEYYRYYRSGKGGWELTCVRRLLTRGDVESFTSTLIVENKEFGSEGLTEVYRAENVPDSVAQWPSTREFRRWGDPDYDGGQALALDVGDGAHTFWIEAELGDWLNEFEKEVTLSIYRWELDEEPVQTIQTATVAPGYLKLEAVDADFDEDMDFYFPYSVGANNGYYSFWLWDQEAETFVEEKAGLGGLAYPHFDPEEKLIYSHELGSATCSTDSIYTWRQGELVCLRWVYHEYSADMETVLVRVSDEALGTLEKTYDRDDDWSLWLDLDYKEDLS